MAIVLPDKAGLARELPDIVEPLAIRAEGAAPINELVDFTGQIQRPKIVALREATLMIDAEATKLCAGLSEEQLAWCPGIERWSIAQNLAHLRMTAEAFLPAIDSAVETSRKLKLHSEGPFALSLCGRMLVWGMEARPIIKMQAPKATRPQSLSSAAAEIEQFVISQTALRRRISDADGLDLTALRFPSPLAGYFHMNLLEFFSICNAHSRRHLRQAHDVRRAMLSSRLRNHAWNARS